MNHELRKNFFDRSSIIVAEELLGKILCRKIEGKIERFEIVETEAYEGLEDKASHASRGKTVRNAPMFEGAGTIYVYFTYGMHYMLNVVCGRVGHPSAVLIRGITPPNPLLQPRGVIKHKLNLIGPGRLTKYLKIDRSLNNLKLGKSSGLWIESPKLKIENLPDGKAGSKFKIYKTPRIGVAYAGSIWANKKYRFVLK